VSNDEDAATEGRTKSQAAASVLSGQSGTGPGSVKGLQSGEPGEDPGLPSLSPHRPGCRLKVSDRFTLWPSEQAKCRRILLPHFGWNRIGLQNHPRVSRIATPPR
jgi:hypothetical protein